MQQPGYQRTCFFLDVCSYPPLASSYSRDLHQMIRECIDQNPDRRPTMDMILNSDAVMRRMNLLPSDAVRSMGRWVLTPFGILKFASWPSV